MILLPPVSTLFPYTTLFRSVLALLRQETPVIPPFVVLMLPATPADRLRAARQSSEGFARGVTRMSHAPPTAPRRSEKHTSELQSHSDLVCRLLLEKKKKQSM